MSFISTPSSPLGFTALYKGLAPTLLKAMTSTSVTFAVYGVCKDRFLASYPDDDDDDDDDEIIGKTPPVR